MTALPEGLPPLADLMPPEGVTMVSVVSMDGGQLLQTMWVLPGMPVTDMTEKLTGLLGAPVGDMLMGNAQEMLAGLFGNPDTDVRAVLPRGDSVQIVAGEMTYTAGDSDGPGTDPPEG